MDAHNVPPQEEYLYKGCWNPQTDDVFLATIVKEKRSSIEPKNALPVNALMCAQIELKQKFNLHVEWEALCERYTFMKKRYETFKATLRYDKIDWEASTNRMFGNDQTWGRIFKKCDLAKAYYTSGEPAFHKLAILFGEDVVKEEDAPKVVVNLSDIVSPVPRVVIEVMSDSEEVNSPICIPNPNSRRQLFDEESKCCGSASSCFPAPNNHPRKMKKENEYGNVQELSSEASSSPKSWWSKP